VTLAWALEGQKGRGAEGPVLLYLGCRFGYFPARAGSLLVLATAASVRGPSLPSSRPSAKRPSHRPFSHRPPGTGSRMVFGP